MIPEAFRPTPRQREHRALVRHRQYLKQSATALKNKMRRIASRLQRRPQGPVHRRRLGGACRRSSSATPTGSCSTSCTPQWQHLEGQLTELAGRLKAFAAAAPAKEAEARAKLATIPGVGPVTVDVVVSELGDVRRFHSVKAVCAYAGLVPAVRQSGGKRRRSWGSPRRARRCCGGRWWRRPGGWSGSRRRGGGCTSRIKKRAGGKKAIVAVARRLLVVMAAMLRDGTNYDFLKVGEPRPT